MDSEEATAKARASSRAKQRSQGVSVMCYQSLNTTAPKLPNELRSMLLSLPRTRAVRGAAYHTRENAKESLMIRVRKREKFSLKGAPLLNGRRIRKNDCHIFWGVGEKSAKWAIISNAPSDCLAPKRARPVRQWALASPVLQSQPIYLIPELRRSGALRIQAAST